MNFTSALIKLEKISQQHVLAYWNLLANGEKNKLLNQIELIDIEIFKKQQEQLFSRSDLLKEEFAPYNDYHFAGNVEDIASGKKIISEGKVGCLIIAGGQGTRLKIEGPKGTYPVSVIKHKSLFQLFAEKTLAAGKQTGRKLFLAIMTSPINHQETIDFFKNNSFFGLSSEQISFFSQGTLPLLDSEGNLFLEELATIAVGPDGNGSSLTRFFSSGIWKEWNDKGIRYLNYILVDNPLADPFDAELVGFHVRNEMEVTIKCTSRKDVKEKVGIIIQSQGKPKIVEYTELSETEMAAKNSDGQLRHVCANLSLFCFKMEFISKLTSVSMPMHLAYKAVKKINGDPPCRTEDMAWKYENFIFDILPIASKIKALLYSRANCFAPLKNYEGDNSIVTVKNALQKLDQETIKNITGMHPPNPPFELSQEFYYPTNELLSCWLGKKIPHVNYIEPFQNPY
jgi:UDP-N-acetylglucosamine/UDP-N-acetylgalactosamine diphosphorylase